MTDLPLMGHIPKKSENPKWKAPLTRRRRKKHSHFRACIPKSHSHTFLQLSRRGCHKKVVPACAYRVKETPETHIASISGSFSWCENRSDTFWEELTFYWRQRRRHCYCTYSCSTKQSEFCQSFPKFNNCLEEPLLTKNSSNRPKQTEKVNTHLRHFTCHMNTLPLVILSS